MKLNYSLADFPERGEWGGRTHPADDLAYTKVVRCPLLTPFRKSVDSPPDVI